MKKIFCVIILCAGMCDSIRSQDCKSMNIQWAADINSTCNTMVMTMLHDALGRPYLYVANKEAGLKIYQINNLISPVLVASVPKSNLDSLDVMNLTQNGNYL